MKNAAFTAIAMLVLAVSTALTAQAQTNGSIKLVANIPFDFNVGDKTMAAGEYTIQQVNPSSDRVVLQIRSMSGDAAVLVATNPVRARASEKSMLLFNRYGNHYFFSKLSIDGLEEAWQAPKSRAERGVAKELADLRPQTATVTLSRR